MGLRVLRVRLAAIAAVTAFAVAAAVAGAAPVSLTVVHSAQNSALGKILVSASGRTLYHDASERKNVVKCLGSCASQWPPLLWPVALYPSRQTDFNLRSRPCFSASMEKDCSAF